ncbi:hypothetical protein LCGC14_1034120 [marine sediment metagenome]|uniref:Phage major capsid protein n=1 Tax=marine sediment metagenome TaxID=412755 RepID=A0A0F9MTR6_9ZZZZ
MAYGQLTWANQKSRVIPWGPAGLNLISESIGMAALGQPEVKANEYKKQQWSSGSSGDTVGTDLTFSATAGSIDVSKTLHMGLKGELLKVDKKAVDAGAPITEQLAEQLNFANEGFNNQFMTDLVGTNEGINGKVQGMGYVLTQDAATQAGQTFEGSGSAYAGTAILKVLNKLSTKVQGTRKVFYVSTNTAPAIYDAIVAAGYGPTITLLDKNFNGSEVLSFNGIPIIPTDKITDGSSYGNTISDIFCLGIGGRQGAHLWVPTAEMVDVDGPITAEGKAYYAFNGYLHAQVHYGSPRCVAKANDVITVDA